MNKVLKACLIVIAVLLALFLVFCVVATIKNVTITELFKDIFKTSTETEAPAIMRMLKM